ncbi:thioredoxin/glutaredoxin [Streptococcus pseudoporcinus]|uniref:Thioredoxin/glutaredoxin n=1 Tax=Streptococcus pseudoporcinus TaxID=361101 RepID=A0A4U9YBF9_9STRE|nr:thioredoxin [Streptococcus pseudoporcinus]VTS24330.1 thioredoxin/glutaredoxin [Streptococcus pseudoporcinus]
MIDKFEWVKLIFATIAAVAILCFTVVGVQTIWTEYVVKDYDRHLTEQVYVDAAVNQNVNLVFYKRGCPYCEAGKKAVINAAEMNQFPTFYIDVESEDGQVLVKKYQVEKAATLITLRKGKSQLYHYAAKDKQGKITADEKTIKDALDDSKS